jgi:hypothetical protein
MASEAVVEAILRRAQAVTADIADIHVGLHHA